MPASILAALALLEEILKLEPYVAEAVKDIFDVIHLWKSTGTEPTQDQLDSIRTASHEARQQFDRE